MKSKKLISVVLALSMMLSMINITAFAYAVWPKYNCTFDVSFEDADGGNSIEADVEYKISYATTEGNETEIEIGGTTTVRSDTLKSFTITIASVPEGYDVPEACTFIEENYENKGNYAITYSKEVASLDYDCNYTIKVRLEKPHNHPVCGAQCGDDCVEGSHEDVELRSLWAYALSDEGTLEAGKYCLREDIETAVSYTISDDTVICLNGHKWDYTGTGNAFVVESGKTLTITDCSEDESGELCSSTTENALVQLNENGYFKFYGGNITNNYNDYTYSVGMCVNGTEDVNNTAYLYGGKMKSCGTYAASNYAVGNVMYVHIGGDFELVGTSSIYVWDTDYIVLDSAFKHKYNVRPYGGRDFTIGWPTYMKDVTIDDYFNHAWNGNGSGTCYFKINPYTGEVTTYSSDSSLQHVYIAETYGGGTVTASTQYCTKNTEVILTIEPEDEYILDDLTVMYNYNKYIVYTDNKDGTYTFEMPGYDVTVQARFVGEKYKATIAPDIKNGTITIENKTEPYEISWDNFVKFTPRADDGYECVSVTVTDSKGNDVKVSEEGGWPTAYSFTMPKDDVTISATFDVAKYDVTILEDYCEHVTITADPERAYIGDTITLTITPDEGYEYDWSEGSEEWMISDIKSKCLDVTFSNDGRTATFLMPEGGAWVDKLVCHKIDYSITLPESFEHGSVTVSNETANFGDEVTLTVTPDSGYKLGTLTVTKANGDTVDVTKSDVATASTEDSEYYTFTMPSSAVSIAANFVSKDITEIFTVSSVVNSATVDKDTTKDGTQVEAGDTVKVDIVVDGSDFTNADWTLVYDYSKFEYVGKSEAYSNGIYTFDNSSNGVLKGSIKAPAGETKKDEFEDGKAVVTYEFKAIAQKKETTVEFKVYEAHANTYEIAGNNNNTPAKTTSAEVTIILIDNSSNGGDEGETVTPIGTFEAATKQYNANAQTGNAFIPEDKFASATITYAAAEDGKEKEELSYKTTLPSWKNVGTYTYYAKITGAGLATTYAQTTLTITPAEITPSAVFEVDPDVTGVKFTPTLEGVLDGSHNGTVTVKYTDKNGDVQTVTLNASDFVYDGETTSVWNGKDQNGDDMTFAIPAQTSGKFTVTLDYTEGENDNYTGDENSVTVDVDKIFADSDTVAALEDSVTSVFGYDSKAHSLEIDDEAVKAIINGTWSYTVSDTTASVTNVGDDALVKVTFTDTTGNYNNVIVYAILKVTPANVKITVNNNSKVMNEADPDPITDGTIKVVDKDGNEVTVVTFNDNGLYGEDNLEVSYEREAGEAVGTYNITASYAPNDNYTVEVTDGTFTITAPSIDPDDETKAIVKVEVVDLSKGNTNGDETPDYTANKRLILVYTDVDKLFYGYKVDDTTTEKMFDVTAAGYKYVDNNYADGTYTEEAHEYKHVYGIVVDAIDNYEATESYEKKYRDNVVFLSSDLEDAPENIVYDGDINLSNTIDVNDYSMTNGIYSNQYARATYIKNILKADINGDKKVDTTDVLNVKTIFEAKNK